MILQMSKAQKAAATNVTKQRINSDELWANGRSKAKTDLKAVAEDEVEEDKNYHSTISSLQRLAEEMHDESNAGVWEQRFNLAMGVVIVINIALIAVEIDWGPDSQASVQDRAGWILIDSLFIVVFIAEVCLRVHWERRLWVNSPWNWLDVVIIITAIVDVWIMSFVSGKEGFHMFVILRIVRLLRLLRMVKLVRALRGLYMMVMAFWAAMKAMSFLCALMVFGLLLFSIFSVTIIGRNSAFDGVMIYEDTVYDRFGTVYRSMYSLFELMTLEGWDRTARPLVERQPAIMLFLALFIMIFTFGILNMVVALVVEKTLDQTRTMGDLSKRQKLIEAAQQLMELVSVFREGDSDESGTLSAEELKRVVQDSRKTLEALGLPVEDAQELFNILDTDNSGSITVQEFVQGIDKLQSGLISTWDAVATTCGVRKLDHELYKLESQLEKMDRIIEDRDQLLQEGLSIVQALQGADGASGDYHFGKGK